MGRSYIVTSITNRIAAIGTATTISSMSWFNVTMLLFNQHQFRANEHQRRPDAFAAYEGALAVNHLCNLAVRLAAKIAIAGDVLPSGEQLHAPLLF
jgi:tryptophan 2,3-dioxygenase